MTRKVAVITGASPDIGTALVTEYRGWGWAVVAAGRTIKRSPDPNVIALELDVVDPASAGRVIGVALDQFGRIDTLVNTAAVVISKPFTDYTTVDYVAVLGLNLSGFFWMTQGAIAEMVRRYGGHVVTVAARASEVTQPVMPAVLTALTNGALVAATRSLAAEYAAYGIRVNAVSSGIVGDPMDRLTSIDGFGGGLASHGRAAHVSDVVDGVLFLESSPRITGEILHLGGGQIDEG
jgi:NAD(P)-dependent dehydrogenase (short-subunit alcohol dehydrogenase family)